MTVDDPRKLQQDSLNPLRDRALSAVGAGQEVSDAGHQAHVRLGSDLAQSLSKQIEPTTRQTLSGTHHWTIATVERGHVPGHVRIPKQRENPHLGHLDEVREPFFFRAIEIKRNVAALGSCAGAAVKEKKNARQQGHLEATAACTAARTSRGNGSRRARTPLVKDVRDLSRISIQLK